MSASAGISPSPKATPVVAASGGAVASSNSNRSGVVTSAGASSSVTPNGFFQSYAARSRLPSILLLFATAVVGLCFRYWGSSVTTTLDSICLSGDDACIGFGLVYRLSFGLALFFLLQAVALAFTTCCSPHFAVEASNFFNSGIGWIVRFVLYAGTLVIAFVMPSDFYDGYVHVARVVSAFLLIIQVAILIDFAYSWNENWMAPEKDWKQGLVAVSLLLYCGSLAALVLLYVYYSGPDADGDSCPLQQFFISWTLIQTLIFTGISISDKCEHGALLPSAVMTAYCYYLVYSALTSDPSTCKWSNTNSDTAHLVIGLVIGCGSLAYASWSLADAGLKSDPSAGFPAVPDENGRVPTREGGGEASVDEEVAMSKEQIKFLLIMFVSAMYMAMLLTSWGSQADAEAVAQGSSTVSYDVNTESMWIKIGTQWAAVLLYVWSLIAPYVCTNRVFNQN